MSNQHLFDLMSDEHGLTLLQSEMEDIKVAILKDAMEGLGFDEEMARKILKTKRELAE